jgi:S1-C subfamily serine protease
MHRGIRIVVIVAIALALGLAFLASQFHAGLSSQPGQAQGPLQSALTKPLEFAKKEFTGGVGVMMSMDPKTGLPRVQGVSVGSPADKAGLQSGDLILEVNGVATSGRKLAQVVESIRGFRGGEVGLKIQRLGSTNSMECFLRRTSWNNLTNGNYK